MYSIMKVTRHRIAEIKKKKNRKYEIEIAFGWPDKS